MRGWQRITEKDQKTAEKILRYYSDHIVLSLKSTLGPDSRLSSTCHHAATGDDYNGEDDERSAPCCIVAKGLHKKSHPIISMNKAIFCDEKRYFCCTHQKAVDIWHPDFILGQTDEYGDELFNALQGEEPLLMKYGHYVYTAETLDAVWGNFVSFKKQSISRTILLKNWYRHYQYKMPTDQLIHLQELLKADGPRQAIEKLVVLIFPSEDTVNRFIQEFGFEYGAPLCQEHRRLLLSKGSRLFIWDATFRLAKAICLSPCHQTKVAVLNVMDEDGDLVHWKWLVYKAESFENLVPELAECVWWSLTTGPFRDEPFVFGTDNAENQCRIIDLIFDCVIDDLNGGRRYINKDGHRHDLWKLRKDSKVC